MGLIGNRLGRGKTGRTRGRGGRLLCRSAKNRNPADLEPLPLANNYNYVQPGAKHTTMEGGISLGLHALSCYRETRVVVVFLALAGRGRDVVCPSSLFTSASAGSVPNTSRH
jgi:hypothetical protein